VCERQLRLDPLWLARMASSRAGSSRLLGTKSGHGWSGARDGRCGDEQAFGVTLPSLPLLAEGGECPQVVGDDVPLGCQEDSTGGRPGEFDCSRRSLGGLRGDRVDDWLLTRGCTRAWLSTHHLRSATRVRPGESIASPSCRSCGAMRTRRRREQAGNKQLWNPTAHNDHQNHVDSR
jgi:hypothetical protein